MRASPKQEEPCMYFRSNFLVFWRIFWYDFKGFENCVCSVSINTWTSCQQASHSCACVCRCVVWVKSELVAQVRLLLFHCEVKASLLPQTIAVWVPPSSRVFWSHINISHLQQVEATLLRTAPSPKLPSYRVLLRLVIGTPGSSLSC